MNSPRELVDFLAVLIYDEGDNRCSEAPTILRSSHPEIAYRLALARGAEQRYGREFKGLAHLEPDVADFDSIACSRRGAAADYVVAKEDLQAFHDPRWESLPCSEEEIAESLREPPLLVELPVDGIAWHTLTHAYGTADDVGTDLRRLASSVDKLRERALWHLSGSIYHQGTLCTATPYAVPFLIQAAAEPVLPNRRGIVSLLKAIAESCEVDPAIIRNAWTRRKNLSGEIFHLPADEMAEQQIAANSATRSAMIVRAAELRTLAEDSDAEVAASAKIILQLLRF